MAHIVIRKVGLVAVLIFAANANATLVFEDWKTTSDSQITRDTVSGLEWLNFSQTTVGHQAVREGLHSTYDGFRFATTQELFGLFQNYVPGLDASGFMFGSDPQIADDLQYVMDSVGFDDERYLFVNTCAFASGCDSLGSGTAGDGLSKNILRSNPTEHIFAVWFGDDADFVLTQALVRVPEPGSMTLMMFGILALFTMGSRPLVSAR